MGHVSKIWTQQTITSITSCYAHALLLMISMSFVNCHIKNILCPKTDFNQSLSLIQQSGKCQAQSSYWKNERSILNESCLESTYGRKDSLTTHLGNQSSQDTDQKAFDSINTEILCQLFPLFKGTQVNYFPKRRKNYQASFET